MPNKLINGRIYTMVNDVTSEFYVGSTSGTLENRLSGHQTSAKNGNPSKFYQYMRAIGADRFRINLIEEYNCDTIRELRVREAYWVEQLHPTLNTIRPAMTTGDETDDSHCEADSIPVPEAKDAIRPNATGNVHRCDICQYTTPVKSNMEKHFNTVKHKTKEALAKLTPKVPEEDATKRKLTCEFCKGTFSQISSLSRHRKSCNQKAEMIDEHEGKVVDLRGEYERQIANLKKEYETQITIRDRQIADLSREFTTQITIRDRLIQQLSDNIADLRTYNNSFRNIAETTSEAVKISDKTLSYVITNK